MDSEPVGSGPSPKTSAASSLCFPFVDALGIDGASISVFGGSHRQITICTTDALAARIESLQFELGEGPHWEVLRTRQPALQADLTQGDQEPWPIFAGAAVKLGIHAVFAFPMMIGAAVVGAVDLYNLTPRHLEGHHLALASGMASRIAFPSIRLATAMASDGDVIDTEASPSIRREVHQATGMIQSQLNTTATDAFARLRAHAFSSGQSVERIAQNVVAKGLDFSALPE